MCGAGQSTGGVKNSDEAWGEPMTTRIAQDDLREKCPAKLVPDKKTRLLFRRSGGLSRVGPLGQSQKSATGSTGLQSWKCNG